ncbi:hypothetical protein CEXT_321321 [Caerostris extrusa]|uniref:Uncharacterized protein n=1 Tax=Caerostris extrusa TaxID=172846 RepID=A0AAV4P0Q1_CAEEX|nr:hypothetical protein CEXT_321321 [Caerostris extrusa]
MTVNGNFGTHVFFPSHTLHKVYCALLGGFLCFTHWSNMNRRLRIPGAISLRLEVTSYEDFTPPTSPDEYLTTSFMLPTKTLFFVACFTVMISFLDGTSSFTGITCSNVYLYLKKRSWKHKTFQQIMLLLLNPANIGEQEQEVLPF